MVHIRRSIFLISQYCLLLAVGSASQASTVGSLNFDHRPLAAGPSPDPGVHHADMSTRRTPANGEAPLQNHEAEPAPRENRSTVTEATSKPGLQPGLPFTSSRCSESLEHRAKRSRQAEPAGIDNVSVAATESRNVDGKAPGAGTSKRTNYLVWDDYFMSVAFLSAMRSKDPSTQVGACDVGVATSSDGRILLRSLRASIVNQDKRIVGIGYNGFPMGCSDDELPWAREADDELDTKYPYVCHAEMNAILNKNSADVKGCLVYVALFPCNECAKLIIQSGIREVVYLSDKYHDTVSMKASRRMFEMAGVRCRQHVPKDERVVIDFSAVSGRR